MLPISSGKLTDRPEKLRALLVSSVLPWPLHRNGGAQRTDLIRQALQAAGYQVDILAAIPSGDSDLPSADELYDNGVVGAFFVDIAPPSRGRLGLAGLGALISPLRARRLMKHRYAPHATVSRWIAEHLGEYGLIVARYLQTALLCGLDRRNPAEPPPVWVDLDDLDWLTLADRLRAQPWPGVMGRLGMAAAISFVRKRCQRALPAFNGLFVTSEQDRQELAALGHQAALLPNIPYVDPADPERLAPLPPPPQDSRELLFLGDLQFPPNITGLEWFLRECWEQVRAAVPDATLRVVGRGLSEADRAAWGRMPGVEIVGFTTDIRGEYARCACTIAPIHWGGGTKIKVVESAALGRVCVVAPHALRGFEPLAEPPSPCILVGTTPEHFAAAVIDLLRSAFHRAELGLNGPVMVQRGYNLEAFAAAVAKALL